MSHTPGPWQRDHYDVTTHDRHIALVTVAHDRQNDGNANLIAAAPDILTALRDLLAASEQHIFGDECLSERDAARVAIAMAERK